MLFAVGSLRYSKLVPGEMMLDTYRLMFGISLFCFTTIMVYFSVSMSLARYLSRDTAGTPAKSGLETEFSKIALFLRVS